MTLQTSTLSSRLQVPSLGASIGVLSTPVEQRSRSTGTHYLLYTQRDPSRIALSCDPPPTTSWEGGIPRTGEGSPYTFLQGSGPSQPRSCARSTSSAFEPTSSRW